MSTLKNCIRRHHNSTKTLHTLKMRAHLNADAMFATIRKSFDLVPDHRAANSKIPLADALMSGFAMFSLKDQSLLAFDHRRCAEPESLHGVYGVGVIPCDSQMRAICDEVSPAHLRRPFRNIFSQAQRGKALEMMSWLDGHYLLALDGTGIYSSESVSSDYCLIKKRRNGTIEYHQQMLAGAIVHPDRREVIPLCPEMIRWQDGATKNDCERNAAKRFLADLRREHPHLKIIITEDALSANTPHIKELERHDLRYILSVKPGDHAFLFDYIDEADRRGEVTNLVIPDSKHDNRSHGFRFINGVPLNQASQAELTVNFLEYWEVLNREGEEPKIIKHFSWVTDIPITKENARELVRGGRARWRIENETFNTLKNQGYNLGHNYGLGKKHLSAVFVHLTMLAFLVDQLQQLCCPLFQAARRKMGCKIRLWELIRGGFHWRLAPSMEAILRAYVDGVASVPFPVPG
ncbi:MAG: transposase [Deltaproteobacteria bacterium CG23_combo_of_CG06-09_8_20_14_all_60_8]|nr:MAG: transposase [Deltaproteobacteria bacterium CG23_combo_of_CG06-09_8_20_14_all_60_8]